MQNNKMAEKGHEQHNIEAAPVTGIQTEAPTLDVIGNGILSKGEVAPVQWLRYYQPTEGGKWHSVPEAQAAELFAHIKPALVATCATSYVADAEREAVIAPENTYYLADHVWFDIDHDAPIDAIEAVHKFVRKLEATGLDLRCLQLYASGKKGFHVLAPLAAFVDDWWDNLRPREMQDFPLICKQVAQGLLVDGVDMRVYKQSRGQQLRAANVQREIGTYKVPLTLGELWSITPDLYAEYVSRPRPAVATVPTEVNNALGTLWDAAAAACERSSRSIATLRPEVTVASVARVSSLVERFHPDNDEDLGTCNALRTLVAQVVRFELGHEAGLPVMREFAQKSQNKNGEFFKSREWLQIFNSSGKTAGKVVTFGTLKALAIERSKGWEDPHPELNPKHDPALVDDATPVHKTELGVAEYIVRKYADKLLYIMDLELWYFWDGKKWERDDDAFSLNRAIKAEGRELRARLGKPLHDALVEATENADKDAIKAAQKALGAHASFYDKLESAYTIKAVKGLMQAEVRRVTHQCLDAEPFLLNVQNGILDLRTGELLPHSPEHLMTKIAAVDYNASAQCPSFQQFIGGVTCSRVELVTYLQETLGYSLSGDMSLQCSYWQIGAGANGKSTLNNTLQKVMGSYALKLPVETLLVSRKKGAGNPDPQLMNMPGSRIVFVTEMADGSQLNEAAFKDLVSTDPLPARNLYAKKVASIRPQFKLWPAFNEVPLVSTTMNGVWRRIETIPFDMDYDGKDADKRDKGMEHRLAAESEGILAWCVDGFMQVWKRAGGDLSQLNIEAPECCQLLKASYRASLDIVGNFVRECLVQDEVNNSDEGQIPAKLLFETYMHFCKSNNLARINSTRFGRDIAKHLAEKERTKRGMVYTGWRISDVWVTADMRDSEGNRAEILEKAIFLTD